jgi:short-subunit dehydrogenase
MRHLLAGSVMPLASSIVLKSEKNVKWLLIWLLSGFFLCSCATCNPGTSAKRKIEGKTYVITGASSGLGRGVAEKLGACKANVVLAARRTELLEEIAEEIRKAGGTALVVTTDVSKPEEVEQLASAAQKKYGHIDVWMNNAGVISIGPFWDLPLEEQARVIDVNLKGVLYGSYSALHLFRTQGYGVLINTGSVDGEIPLAYQATYSATKAAIHSLGISLNQELRLQKNKRINVVTIAPWAVDTPIWRHAANHSGGTARMGAMDAPEKVVNAMIWSSLHPCHKELPVGWKARLAYKSHRLFPHCTERMTADVVHHYQIKTAPPAPSTSGNLFEAMEEGRGIEDGVRERIKQEKRERRLKRKNKK